MLVIYDLAASSGYSKTTMIIMEPRTEITITKLRVKVILVNVLHYIPVQLKDETTPLLEIFSLHLHYNVKIMAGFGI